MVEKAIGGIVAVIMSILLFIISSQVLLTTTNLQSTGIFPSAPFVISIIPIVIFIEAILLPERTKEEIEDIEKIPLEPESEGFFYFANIQCHNCFKGTRIKIPKNYKIQEALKISDYYCETCGVNLKTDINSLIKKRGLNEPKN